MCRTPGRQWLLESQFTYTSSLPERTLSGLRIFERERKTLVGAQMRYAVHDRDGWPLAMLGFSTAAWMLAPRDHFIGWTPQLREKNLPLVVDNPRFLILSWIHFPNLGSHSVTVRPLTATVSGYSGLAALLTYNWNWTDCGCWIPSSRGLPSSINASS